MKDLKNYIAGKWVDADNEGWLEVENPSTGEILARNPLSTAAEADRAIAAAAEAYPAWSQTPVSRRVQPLYKLTERIRAREEEIARVLVAEMGKSMTDARAEMKRTLENCETACGMPVLQQGDKLIGCSFGIDGEVIRVPLGVFTLIAPFNFPAMVPFWFIPYALATGNTFVAKPSPRVPMTMQLLTELIAQSGFPPGVFNLVNGDRSVADAFMDNPQVKGVSMVGSTATCRIIAGRCAKSNKRFQAMGSAKNHLVVMPDARMEEVVRNMVTSCFGCAGQRCMASSAIIAVGDNTYKTIGDLFIEDSKKVILGNPLDPRFIDEPMLMGPVISAKAKEFIHRMIDTGVREGAVHVGDTALAQRPCVAIVGARNASAAAVKLARQFAGDLAEAGFTVVSGLARGIDGAAHRAALPGGTIGVIASGIDVTYPPEHADLQEQVAVEGLLLAEQP
ncbi:MAG TPA: aldehyde dehydrogenase family protein, partial [bacterium]|nr:aldehyde dehydrogenase family protein [bacterium]